MSSAIKLFSLTGLIFLVIDLIWLLVISRQLYQNYLGGLLGKAQVLPAIIFYVLYILGILFFAIYPALAKESLAYAILAGGFLGLLCYGTYDLTNLATLKNWSVVITVIDLIWGMAITAVTSGSVYALAKLWKW